MYKGTKNSLNYIRGKKEQKKCELSETEKGEKWENYFRTIKWMGK